MKFEEVGSPRPARRGLNGCFYCFSNRTDQALCQLNKRIEIYKNMMCSNFFKQVPNCGNEKSS